MRFFWWGFLALSMSAGEPQTIVIEADDLLRFNMTTIHVKSGGSMTLVFKNTGKIPSMQHNFVLLKAGADAARFGNAAMNAKQDEFIPKAFQDQVVVHSRLLQGGQSETLTFAVPPKGTYSFLCSYPGHFSVSKGTLIVE